VITLAEARGIVAAAFAGRRVVDERVDCDAARGRVLAHDLVAPFDVPGFVHSAMDGYAVRAQDLAPAGETRLRCIAVLLAGRAAAVAVLGPGECARITTGAPLPSGADTVVMKENSRTAGEDILVSAATPRGTNVRGATDDYAAGDRALAAGKEISPAAIATAHAFGLDSLMVRSAPRAAIVVTGDELVRPGATRGFGQRYESNGALLRSLVAESGARAVSVEFVGDEPDAISAALARAARGTDLVLTTGGVSAGEADFLPTLVERLGRIAFWKVRMRPGMPVLFGEVFGTPVFALPGNPVSVFATYLALVEPAIDALLGAAARREVVHARLRHAADKRHDRVEFRRATLAVDASGVLHADLHATLSSGALRSVVESGGLAELPAATLRFDAGDAVRVHRFRHGT